MHDTALTYTATYSNILSKMARFVYRLGYLRAARELERLGYEKEALECYKNANTYR